MPHVPFVLSRLRRSQRGVTNIEYALVAVLISAVLVVASNNLGANLQNALNSVANVLN